MKFRIIQTGTREFRDVYEFDLTPEEYTTLKQNLRDDDRCLAEVQEHDLYELDFELDHNTLVDTQDGQIVEDQIEIELVRTRKKVLDTAE
jgi:hypothetical protein